MRSSKIKVLNNNPKAGDTNLVKARDLNNVVEDLEFIYPKYDQPFSGEVYLGRLATHYSPYTVTTDIVITASTDRITLGAALIRMIADGSHTPNLSAFKKDAGSGNWNTTVSTVHVVVFYYDGVDIWYTITVAA